MNLVRSRGLSWEPFAAIFFACMAVALMLLDCKASAPPEPPLTVVDASDASALLDVGADASTCALACARFAALGCREARPQCVTVCDRARATHLIQDLELGCVVAAGDRSAVQACGAFCR